MSKANVKSLYNKFQTDLNAEVQGKDLDLGVCVITCARAGGSNLQFEDDFTKTFQPFTQVMDLGEMPEEKARELTYGVYARTVIKRWQYRDPTTLNLYDGLGEDDEGKPVPASMENIVELLKSAHDMYLKIRSFAASMETYSIANRQAAAKN